MARLQRRFSPNRIRLGSAGNTPLLGGASDTTLCLVGRELCLFTTLDARQVPAKQRKTFAELAVRRTAPFPDPDFDAAWSADGTASIWYWQRSRVAALAASEPGRRKRFIAEALYVGRPVEQGCELLQLSSGVEARAWKSTQLHASRWWPNVPSLAQWHEFLRSAGHPSAAIPELTPAELANTAWSKQAATSGALQLSGLDQYLPKAVFAIGLLFLALTGVELGSGMRAQIDIWRAQSAATRLDAPLQRILDARDATDQASAEIAQLLPLRGLRPTISLMAEVTRLMAGSQWQLSEWNQPTTDTVEITLIAPGSNPEKLVSAWEDSPMFKDVTTELGRNNELVIKASLTAAPNLGGEPAP